MLGNMWFLYLLFTGSHVLPPHLDFYNIDDSDESTSTSNGNDNNNGNHSNNGNNTPTSTPRGRISFRRCVNARRAIIRVRSLRVILTIVNLHVNYK